GEIELSSRLSPTTSVGGGAMVSEPPISPLAEEMSGRTEGGVQARPNEALTPTSAPAANR
ncbi:MAG: ABC transporter ATP-binding protein, partial [Mesorhizobium sp.]